MERPEFRKILAQAEYWWTADGARVRIADMTPEHCARVLAFVNERTQLRRAVGRTFPLIDALRARLGTANEQD